MAFALFRLSVFQYSTAGSNPLCCYKLSVCAAGTESRIVPQSQITGADAARAGDEGTGKQESVSLWGRGKSPFAS